MPASRDGLFDLRAKQFLVLVLKSAHNFSGLRPPLTGPSIPVENRAIRRRGIWSSPKFLIRFYNWPYSPLPLHKLRNFHGPPNRRISALKLDTSEKFLQIFAYFEIRLIF